MRFNTLFSGALVATSAVNILLASAAHAGIPNGWEQAGSRCYAYDSEGNWGSAYRDSNPYYRKLQKKSDSSKYGVHKNDKKWIMKGVTLAEANAKMNEKCEFGYYGGTSSDDPRDQPSY